MSIQLQLAIPLFVAAAALILVAILRKYLKIEVVVVCLALIGMGVLSLTAPNLFETGMLPEQVTELSESDTSSIVLAQQFMCAGEYDAAMEVLQELQAVNGSDPEVGLTVARCKLLQKDYAGATQAYNVLKADEQISEEAKLAQELYAASQPNNNALIAELLAQGKDPSKYGLVEIPVPSIKPEDIKALLEERLKASLGKYEKTLGKTAVNATKRAVTLFQQFNQFNLDGSFDKDAVKSCLSNIKKAWEDVPSLRKNKHLRLSQLKGYILQQNYAAIAAMVDENSCSEELMIVTELFIGGKVDADDFSPEYINGTKEQRERVLEACKEALKRSRETLNDEDYDAYQVIVQQLAARVQEPIGYNLQQQLVEQAETASPNLQSKNYMTLAKLEKNRGNDTQADAYISDALGSAGMSDDAEYREPMLNMLQIAQGTADSEEVKSVAEYAQQAMDNSLPLNVAPLVSEEKSEELTDHLEQSVNESVARLNIGKIDISKFPEVTARVQIQSTKWSTLTQLQENLIVYDCSNSITNFRLEKMPFNRSRIILLCDVSGSMSGSEEDMKNAIITFAEGMGEGEEVCVIGFDSSIQFVHEFSSDPAVVAGYADSIYAGGGTALYRSLLECEQYLSTDNGVNNIIIAMTDGQDGSSVGEDTMRQELGQMVTNTGATVYTLGLGGVDTDYLEMMAYYGNGSFLYADERDKLSAFYDFIHGQLRNQYLLTFTAQNETLNERKLELSIQEELCRGEKTYYLKEPEGEGGIGNVDEEYVATNVKRKVKGLSVRSLARSSKAQTVNLVGEGFQSGDKISVWLKGASTRDVQAKYVSDKIYEITIPENMAAGIYGLEVQVGGETFKMENELSIYESGKTETHNVGSYTFTANSKHTGKDGTVVLSGNVTMNNYLHFVGELHFVKNVDKVTMIDLGGAYISFGAGSTGLAKTMADTGIPLWLGILGHVELTEQPYNAHDRDDFYVDQIRLDGTVDVNMGVCSGIEFSVYPNMVQFQSFEMDLEVPLIEQLFQSLDKDGESSPFDMEGKVLINAMTIGISGKVSYEDDRDVKVGSLPIRVEKAEVEIDTLSEDYKYGLQLKFKKFLGMEGIGGEIAFTGGRFSSFTVETDVSIPVVKTPVPVGIKGLGLKVDGFDKDSSDTELLEAFLNKEFVVKFKLDVANVEDLIPELASFLDIKGVPLLSADGSATLKLRNFKWGFKATTKFLDIVDVGWLEIAIGNYSYTNELLGIYDADNCGLMAELTNGIDLSADSLKLEIKSGGRLDAGYPYTSVTSKNQGYFEWGWIEKEFKSDATIAIFKNKNGDLQFSLKIRGIFGVDIVEGRRPSFQFGRRVGQ